MLGMNTSLPSASVVSARLKALKMAEIESLASQSGVPFATLLKIRMGTTPNPGLETVRKFFHLLPAELAQQNPHPAQEPAQGVSHA
jgi:hypothetical protein